MSIPVICDRCRATGSTGQGDFAHLGDLLDFIPAPRKHQRADGWSPDRQRAFIAALSATGSKTRAAKAVGMAAFGIDRILKDKGNPSFKAAYQRALAIAAQHGSMKLAQGVADAAARAAQLAPVPSRLRGLPSPPGNDDEPEDDSDDRRMDLIEHLATRFQRKVAAERAARLAGEIVAADFYLRQVTVLETVFDLTASAFGCGAHALLASLRRGPHDMTAIISTPFADWLDRRRREWWAREGDPERPPYPDSRFTRRHSTVEGDCWTAIDQSAVGDDSDPAEGYSREQWAAIPPDQQRAIRQERFRQYAEEQQEWEAQAHRDYESRRDSEAPA